MSLSTEALVAAFLAIVFGVLSLGAIAREQGQPGTSRPNAYVATSNLELNHIAARGSHSPLSGSGQNDVLGFY
jgi:hypothetical protein